MDKKFELAWKTPPGEDGNAVAFHPSGFHILASVGDKFYLMNVLSGSLNEYHSFQMKNCSEIRFSHGGHMFAAGNSTHTQIFNFYTIFSPPEFLCKGHSGKIINIDWFDDDSGFADCCNQGQISFYDLQ